MVHNRDGMLPRVIGSLVLALGLAGAAFGALQWGANVHAGGSSPQALANTMAQRNLMCARMDLWGNDHNYLAQFRNAATFLNAKGIRIEAVVFTVFSRGQSRSQDTGANLTEVEQTAYNQTRSQIDSTKDLVHDYELQNEISLYPNIKASGATGQNASDYNVAEGRLQAAVLHGMSRAIDDVRRASGLPLRIILGTTDRSFGMLTFMQQQGVLFDVVGYHIYPWEQNAALDQDTWYGTGGPLGQLAGFSKPIHINEFNAGEIYSGTGGYSSRASYENLAGQPVTEAGFRSVDKHLKEIVNQTVANVEAVLFYEIWDEPTNPAPENRFGLYYDAALTRPKISLYLASCYAGGALSAAERDSLTRRGLGQCSSSGIAAAAGRQATRRPAANTVWASAVASGAGQSVHYQFQSDGVIEICSLSGKVVRRVVVRSGRASVVWDCADGSGGMAAHGVYLLRLRTGAQATCVRLPLTR
jgi:hypothetical protein